MRNTSFSSVIKAGVFAAASVAALNASAVIQITDTFENRLVGEVLQGDVSGPNIPLIPWGWHNAGGDSGPVVAEHGGNQFINLSGKRLASASFTDRSSNLTLQAKDKSSLSFDLLWLDSTPGTVDSNAFLVYYNVNGRWVNVPATNNVQGYRLGVMATGPDTATWFIQQKTTEFKDVARGTVQIRGLINNADNTTPGTSLPVTLEWNAKHIVLTIAGTVVYNSGATPFSPTPANLSIQGETYLQLWSDASKARGLDNLILKSGN